MNELLAILPYKFILAAYSYLPALIVLSLGYGSVGVGLVTSVSLIGTLFGPVIWSRFAQVTNRKYLIALAYLGMVLGLFLLTKAEWVYFSVFVLSLFPQAAYFVAIAEIRRKEENLAEVLGNLEEAVGIIWAVGLFIGFVGIEILSLDQFAILLAAMGTVSIPIVTRAIEEISIRKTISDGFEELKELEHWVLGAFGKIKIKHPMFYAKKDAKYLYLFGITFSLATGIIYPQLPTLLDRDFGAARLVYLCVLIDALASAAIFRMAGLLKDKSYIFGYITRALGYFILLGAVYTNNMLALLIFFFMNGISWGFIMMFFEYSGIVLGEQIFGTMLSLRLLAYAISSGFSGFIIEGFGFFETFSIGVGMFLFTFLFYVAFEKEKVMLRNREIPKTSSEIHTQ